MKHLPTILVLVVVLGLAAMLIALNQKATDERQTAVNQMDVLSNAVSSITSRVNELREVNLALESNIALRTAQYSNELAASEARCAAAAAELAQIEADTRSSAQSNSARLAELDKQILDLEARHQGLDSQSVELQGAITNLQGKIDDTRQRLAKSMGDRRLLLGMLKQLMAKRADLERDFNDITTVRNQIRKIKTEIREARIRDWVRRGVYASFNQKGAERLVHPVVVLPPRTNAAWKVELHENDVSEATSGPAAPAPQ